MTTIGGGGIVTCNKANSPEIAAKGGDRAVCVVVVLVVKEEEEDSLVSASDGR